MNPLILVLAFAATPSAPRTEAGFRIREEVRIDGIDAGWQQTEIAFGKVRRETSKSPEVIVMDPTAAAPILRILPQAKAWSGVDRALFDAGKTPGPFVEGLGVNGDVLDVPAQPFHETGRTETIGTWTAREYVSVAKAPGGFETRLWLADAPAGLPNDAIAAIAARVYSRRGNAWESYFKALKALGGFPVRTVYRFEMNGTVREVVSTVTVIEKKPLQETAFQVPPAFTRMQAAPGME